MKKVSLVDCRLRDDGYLDIPTKNLKECEIIEDELFELVSCESDAWSGKKVIVHEFCDNEYQKAIPIEKVNLFALMMNRCKRIEGYVPDPNNDYTKDNSLRELCERSIELRERRMNTLKNKRKTFAEVKGILSSFLNRDNTKVEISNKYIGRQEVNKFHSCIEENQIKLHVNYTIREWGAPEWISSPPKTKEFIINENNSFLAGHDSLKVFDGESNEVLFSIYCYETICFDFDYHFLDKSDLKMVAETSY